MHSFLTENELPVNIKERYSDLFDYLNTFLNSPHPGRDGAVCPFVRLAKEKESIFFRLVDAEEMKEFDRIIAESVTFHTENNKAKIGSLVIVFTFDIKAYVVDKLQRKHKVFCVERNVMIGSLNPDNNSESIRLPGFYPLRSPIPILVLRDMVYSDLLFLQTKTARKSDRIKFLESYIKKFEPVQAGKVQEKVAEARKMLEDLKRPWFF